MIASILVKWLRVPQEDYTIKYSITEQYGICGETSVIQNLGKYFTGLIYCSFGYEGQSGGEKESGGLRLGS